MLNHWYKQKKQNDCYLGKLVVAVVIAAVVVVVIAAVVVVVIVVVVFVAEQSQTFVRQTNNGQCC